ncbi:HlyD family secretion protein [Vibrio comitans]|uniref:Transporter n=1 Tax=Vibrio comitans NBRC 102076 TaxID=1219078 RepID=A0A4Y3IJG9_9VIBR|nr:HlyD family secretion protein [Vibrio comitans]GEA58844.1 transporter [Vibrio comitans NBRC 102076]
MDTKTSSHHVNLDESVTPSSESVNNDELWVRKVTMASLVACVLLLAWYLAADRLTPFTDNSRVRAYVFPISASVSGQVVELPVINNQLLQEGEVLARIDPEKYQLAVEKAEAALELAGSEVGAKTANVAVAQANLVKAKTNLELVKVQADRILSAGQKGFVSKAEIDRANSQLDNAQSELVRSKSVLEQAKLEAGINGDGNPRVKKAVAELLQAQVDLEHTTIRAPSTGLVANVRYDIGVYTNVGQPIMTYISTKHSWLEAYLRENNLEHIQAGNEVEIVFDSAPGRVFKGSVKTISYGVEFNASSSVGNLQTPVDKTGWLREAQRFPVTIDFVDPIPTGVRREGGQADIIIHTEDSGVMYWLGKLYIRLMSVLSYVY